MKIRNFHILNNINAVEKLNKDELLSILKKEAFNINIIDIMNASIFLSEEAKYVQGSYRNTLNHIQKHLLQDLKFLKMIKKNIKDI